MIKFITLLLLLLNTQVNASIIVNGSFEATQTCPAYLSKNNKSNPDGLYLIPQQKYQLKEINHSNPDWLRLEMPNKHHELRWVSVDCGVSDYVEHNPSHCENIPGKADAYVLALSSQSGFCQTYGYEAGKPECLKLSKMSYQASHLTLHGLWPNQQSCGEHYGFCGVKPKSNHCDYSPLNLDSGVSEQLKKMMPSYQYGSCLERHEWNKHGSCQVLSNNEYFSLAMRFATEADQSTMGKFLTEHNGDTVKLSSIRDAINQSFGASNSGKIYLGCKSGTLVDIFIVLPALIPYSEPLSSLINKAPDYNYRDSCPNLVHISDFYKQSWY